VTVADIWETIWATDIWTTDPKSNLTNYNIGPNPNHNPNCNIAQTSITQTVCHPNLSTTVTNELFTYQQYSNHLLIIPNNG